MTKKICLNQKCFSTIMIIFYFVTFYCIFESFFIVVLNFNPNVQICIAVCQQTYLTNSMWTFLKCLCLFLNWNVLSGLTLQYYYFILPATLEIPLNNLLQSLNQQMLLFRYFCLIEFQVNLVYHIEVINTLNVWESVKG